MYSMRRRLAAAAAAVHSMIFCLGAHQQARQNDTTYDVIVMGEEQLLEPAWQEAVHMAKPRASLLMLADASNSPRHVTCERGPHDKRLCSARQRVAAINTTEHTVRLSDGQTFRYGKLILAPGAAPVAVPASAIGPGCSEKARLLQQHAASVLRAASEINTRAQLLAQDAAPLEVVIVGASMPALQLLSTVATLADSSDAGSARVRFTLVTQEPAPLNDVLPRPACDVIRKALEQFAVPCRVVPFALLLTTRQGQESRSAAMDVFVQRTYDSMATMSMACDLLVFAPAPSSVPGETRYVEVDNSLEAQGQLMRVNRELCAADSVYACANVAYNDPVCGLTAIAPAAMPAACRAAVHNALGRRPVPFQHVPAEVVALPALGLTVALVGTCTTRLPWCTFSAKRGRKGPVCTVSFCLAESGRIVGAAMVLPNQAHGADGTAALQNSLVIVERLLKASTGLDADTRDKMAALLALPARTMLETAGVSSVRLSRELSSLLQSAGQAAPDAHPSPHAVDSPAATLTASWQAARQPPAKLSPLGILQPQAGAHRGTGS